MSCGKASSGQAFFFHIGREVTNVGDTAKKTTKTTYSDLWIRRNVRIRCPLARFTASRSVS